MASSHPSTALDTARRGDASMHGVTPPPRPGHANRLIGEIVVDLGFADQATVEATVTRAREEGKTTGQALLDAGEVQDDQLARVLAVRFGVDYIDLSVYRVDVDAMKLLDVDTARRCQAVPVGFLPGGRLRLAMADPSNVLTLDDISMITGLRVEPAAASQQDVRALIARYLRSDDEVVELAEEEPAAADRDELVALASEDAPIVKLVQSILGEAIEQAASDIHFNPEDGEVRVLYRVDGVLHPGTTLRQKVATRVISRIKVMASLDVAERRTPQDGRLVATVDRRRVDVRVVTLPLVTGEALVLGILDRGVVVRDLDALGMLPPERERFARSISARQGAVLVTGPTGSGKLTTLYAAINAINTGDRSILTIEDPVESRIPGVKQMQIAPKAGVTFAAGLRSLLLADPDVIMVGEIRDAETANIAVEAALTGHLILSALHTRDAPAALTRLIDMGVPPFLVASAIDCVVAQRLARKLCLHCKRPSQLPDAVLEEHGLADSEPFEAVGCSRCAGTGYRGRIGLYEILRLTDDVRGVVLARGSTDQIAAAAVSDGMRRMRDTGMEQARIGETSIAEVGRVTGVS